MRLICWIPAGIVSRSSKSENIFMMLDLLFILIAVCFFLVSWAYVRGCDRL